jgi:hypothetical protein
VWDIMDAESADMPERSTSASVIFYVQVPRLSASKRLDALSEGTPANSVCCCDPRLSTLANHLDT